MITNFGWFYMLITAFFVLFVIVLAISPYGNIRLGKPDDRPEFSWIGMLFAAGIGVGFVFFGIAEPLLYYLDTPVGIEPETREAALAGLRYSSYHWALHPWAIFSIVGLTLAYVQFRKGRPALISSAFYPLIGRKTDGWMGQMIDILAVLATCTGVATTFGLSAMQISGGGGLDALQTASLIAAFPFAVIMILLIISVLIMLKRDWSLYQRKTRTSRDTAVKEEFREEFLDDVKEDVYEEVKENVYDEIEEEVYEEIKEEMKEEIIEELDINDESHLKK